MTREYLTDLVYKVNGSAIQVHKKLGPGLLESIYHRCMIHELKKRNINYCTEMIIPIDYDGLKLDANLRCDLLVENILPIHVAQLLTYMKLLKLPIGLMINFNCTHIFSEGQKTYVNEFYEAIY
jgi:GxxExxY protein